MDNVIPFPIKDKSALQSALATFRKHYATAGLSTQESDAAIEELTPILEKYLGDKFESIMDIPANCGLTAYQADIISSAHNKCVQDIFAHFSEKLGMSLCEIAGLVGSKYAP